MIYSVVLNKRECKVLLFNYDIIWYGYLIHSLWIMCQWKNIITSYTIYKHVSDFIRFNILQYSNQFALGGWSWTVLSYRVQRKVITSDLGRSYLLPTRAKIKCQYKRGLTLSTIITANIQCCFMQSLWQTFDNFYSLSTS